MTQRLSSSDTLDGMNVSLSTTGRTSKPPRQGHDAPAPPYPENGKAVFRDCGVKGVQPPCGVWGGAPKQTTDFVVLDVETRYSADEVGGWHKASRMGVSIAVLYDSRTGLFTPYTQEEIPALATVLADAPLVVGFNLLRFDYAVLEPHAPGFTFRSLPTLDMLVKIHEQLSYRVSLDNLSGATLGAKKSANGLLALQWWKERRLDKIEEYCAKDVLLTRDLYLFGKEHGYLLFTNKAGQSVRVRAVW